MHPLQERFTFLFNRYYDGLATTEETDELLALIQSAKDDVHLSQLMKEKWENSGTSEPVFSARESERIINAILPPNTVETEEEDAERKVIPINWWRYAAAAVVLLVGFGVFWNWRFNQKEKPLVAVVPKTANPVFAGQNRATLTLGDGSVIHLDRIPNGFLTRQGDAIIRKTKADLLVYEANVSGKTTGGSQTNTLTTPTGGQYQVILPDGSKVWLNACSSIRFPAVFSGNERRVELKGEAFFEVKKDKNRPFRALFAGTEVDVLGTSFNIMAYENETSSRTTLIEGSVLIKHAKTSRQLIPNQQASVRADGRVTVEAVDTDEAMAWKNGLFYFKDAGIESVMKQIARWYDIEVSYEGTVPVKQLTGKVPRTVKLGELLNILQYAGIQYRLDGRKVVIYSKTIPKRI